MEPIVLSRETRVVRNENVLFRVLAGESVLLNLATGHYFGLDRVGTRIWELLEAKEVLSEILAGVLEEFEVDEETAWSDLLRLVTELREKGLVRT